MFYKTGVDITNDKQMFNFLKNHFEYYVMSSWNRVCSIANNVKLYNLNLTGDWTVAQNLLDSGEYETLHELIYDWMASHPGYEVRFNGRSGGYLVLCYTNKCAHILPEEILECDNYDEYKRYCKEYCGSVKVNRSELVFYTKLVQDFDKLCDTLREYCDELSRQTFEIVEMQKAVEQFNEVYFPDLEFLDFGELRCENDGAVDLSELLNLHSLTEAFLRLANRSTYGYKLEFMANTKVRLVKK